MPKEERGVPPGLGTLGSKGWGSWFDFIWPWVVLIFRKLGALSVSCGYGRKAAFVLSEHCTHEE